jgi:hypothetical protein
LISITGAPRLRKQYSLKASLVVGRAIGILRVNHFFYLCF